MRKGSGPEGTRPVPEKSSPVVPLARVYQISIVYVVSAEPLSSPGTSPTRSCRRSRPSRSTPTRGGSGTPAVKVIDTGALSLPFVARNWKVYSVPLFSCGTVYSRAPAPSVPVVHAAVPAA